MKKIILLFALFVGSYAMQAQNTFPTTGNVGIGTTSPKSALEVNGDISLTRSNKIQFLDAVNGNNRAYIRSTNGENGDYNSLIFAIGGGTESMAIKANTGNVGIGTTNPAAKLEILGSNTDLPILKLRNSKWICNQRTSIEFWNGRAKNHPTSRIVSQMDGCGTQGEALRFETQTAGETNPTVKMTLKNNGNVGIGTTNPAAKLDISGGSTILSSYFHIRDFDSSGDANSTLISRDGNSMFWNGGVVIGRYSNNSISGLSQGNLIVQNNVGIGTTNPSEKLTVKGKILCGEVEVVMASTIPADYVFQKYYTGASVLKADYVMPSLEEVEAFTKANHHLPEVPSAATIKEDGLQLKEMTTLLLQKVEELTLYTIEQEKRIKSLETKLVEKN